MLLVKRYVIVQRYEQDPGVVYEMTGDELEILLQELGELEPIIDAINVLNGASIEQRARDIGCQPEDFWYENHCSDDEDLVIQVADLKLAQSQPLVSR